MALLIIFTLVGVGLGEAFFYTKGWLIGGALGFLFTRLFQMSQAINTLERDLKQLQSRVDSQPAVAATSQGTLSDQVEKAQAISDPAITNAATSVPMPVTSAPTQRDAVDQNQDPAPDPWLQQAPPKPPASAPSLAQAEGSPDALPRSAPYQREPRQPNAIERGAAKLEGYVRQFFTQGNPIVRIGMLVLFFGLSFLVKYAAGEGLFPLELRMTIVAAVAMGLIGLGWKTRAREAGYGLVLQGGGVAALYLTLFAAAKLYSLMPAGLALGLMLLVVVLGVLLALLQNAQVLALMATAGGFLAPILTSDGSGNHVGLFSFYLLLNIGILATALFKTWRLLNWVGFVFTFVISAAWGLLDYQAQFYASTQPFLIAFFALYLAVSILFSLKQPPKLKGLVDGSLIFGLPIVGFGLQAGLVHHTDYGVAISALVLALVYIGLARLLWARYQSSQGVLIESFIALGVTFATLTIPLALDAQWTSATWALEAAGLIWVGLRQGRLLPRCAGYLLYLAAAASLLLDGTQSGSVVLLQGDFIGLLILAIAGFGIGYIAHCFADGLRPAEKQLSKLAQIIAWLWWLHAGYLELVNHLPGEHHFAALTVFFVVSTLALLGLSKRLQWPALADLGFWLLPLTALWALRHFGEGWLIGYGVYPSQGWGLLALLVFFAAHYWFLWGRREHTNRAMLSAWHLLTAWFLFGLIYWEASHWQAVMQWSDTWSALLWFSCLALPLGLLLQLTPKPLWPFSAHPEDYKNLIPAPLMLGLLFWFVAACRYSGMTDQFYLPILNPLDLAQVGVLVIFAYAVKRGFIGLSNAPAELRYGVLGLLGFVLINVVLLRAIHQYAAIDYNAAVMWNSVVVQMSLSILWAVCALAIMNLSRRLQERKLWMLGAGLLGLVLLKLFTKDLTGTGTLARIVSFMVVGGLMLLIGYLSPIPAKAKLAEEEKS